MNEKEHEVERLLRAGPPRQRQERSWRCPNDTTLAAYADAKLAPSRTRRIEAHLGRCGYCLAQVAFLARTRESKPPVDVPAALLARAKAVGERGAPRPGGRRWLVAATATAAAALALTLILRMPVGESRSGGGDVPTVRSEGRDAVPRVLVPREASVVAGDDVSFRWQSVPRVLFYRLRLLSATGDPVWQTRTEATETRLPADVRLVAGETYFVSVEAYLPEGRALKAPAVGFEIGR